MPRHLPSAILASGLVIASLIAPMAQGEARADDGGKACDCSQFESFVPQQRLALAFMGMSFELLKREGRIFKGDTDDWFARIPKHCREKLGLHEPKWSAQVVMEGGRKGIKTSHVVNRKWVDQLYELDLQMYRSVREECPEPCGRQHFVDSWQKYQKALASGAFDNWPGMSPQKVKIVRLYHHVFVNSSTEADAERRMRTAVQSGGLTFEEALATIQLHLNVSGSGIYDHEEHENDLVTGDQILDSTRDFHIYALGDQPEGPRSAWTSKAGRCRHHADFGRRMAIAAGAPKAFSLGFFREGDSHRITAAVHPGNPNRVTFLNYGARLDRAGVDGSRLAYQGARHLSLEDRWFGDKLLVAAPSEMLKTLEEASGGDISDLDKLAARNSQFQGVSVSRQSTGMRASVRVLRATDGNGATYFGPALNADWSGKDLFPGSAGAAVMAYTPSLDTSDAPPTTAHLAFGRVEQHARTPVLKLRKDVEARIDGHILLNGMAHRVDATHESEPEYNAQIRHQAGAGARVSYRSSDQKLRATASVGVQGSRGHKDARDSNSDGGFTSSQHAELEAGYRHESFGAMVKGTLVHNAMISTRGRLEGALLTRHAAATAYVSGALTRDAAPILDQSLRRTGGSLSFSLAPGTLSLSGERVSVNDDTVKDYSEFMARFEMLWDLAAAPTRQTLPIHRLGKTSDNQ
jgi:hypothetical protein